MAPRYAAHDLNLELAFDRFLGEAEFEILQRLLPDLLPDWSRDLRVWQSWGEKVPIDLERPGALGSTVTSAATARGPLYKHLVERSGPPVSDRTNGSAELRGSSPALIMVVSIDEMILRSVGPRSTLGNRIAFQVRRPKIERRAGAGWVRSAFIELCDALAPAWASAEHPDEYWAKVMSERPSIQAVGRDFARHLPGLFWMNCFGRPYVDLVGERALLATPATEVLKTAAGVVIVRGDDPRAWASSSALVMERRILDHLGADLFWDSNVPDRAGRAPDWEAVEPRTNR